VSSSVSKSDLPFIGNNPLKDVYWMILLIPFWWILGIEQFIYPVILSLASVKIIITKRGIQADKLILFYVLFLIVYIISAFYVTEPERYLTFARNFGAYYSAVLILFIFYNERLEKKYCDLIIKAVVIVMIIAAIIGFLGITGIYRQRFTSLIGYFLPSFITNTTYGGLIANRSIGVYQWFILFGGYFRVTSMFLFSTFFASAIAIVFPLFWYKYRMSVSRRDKMILAFLILLLLINLAFTTGRIAIGSLFAGLVFIYFYHHVYKIRMKRILIHGGFILISFVILIAIFREDIHSILDAAIYARGEGSASSRLGVYKATLSGFLERPFFGWGSERDVIGLRYPAGSHSNYLGILYKQGVLGFLLFLGIYVITWFRISSNEHLDPVLKRTIQGTFIIVLLNGMTDVLDLDATTFIFAWLIFGLGIYGMNRTYKVSIE
jgi:O-antigen ligase